MTWLARHFATGRIDVRRLWVLTATTAAFLAVAGPVAASVPIHAFNTLPSTTQAGAHPDVEFSFHLGNRSEVPTPCACDDARNVTVHLPTGLTANPHAVPQCSIAQFASDLCPVDSQVGVSEVRVSVAQYAGEIDGFTAPVFNLIPPPEEAGLLGFKTTFDTPVFTVASARTDSDYGLNAIVANIDHFASLVSVKQILWGVPAAPIHDYLRFRPSQSPLPFLLGGGVALLCNQNGAKSTEDPTTAYQVCSSDGEEITPGYAGPAGALFNGSPKPEFGPVSSNSPEAPFTQNPTTCGVSSLQTSLNVLAYDEGMTEASAPYPATTDCDQLAFNPSLFARPTATETDTPSGIDIDLKAPSFESPNAPSPSEIRGTTVTLPPGFTINPNAADGKTSCTEAQARFGTTEEAHCPEFAKVGTVEVHSPVLPGVLPGGVYIGEPKPGDRYRLVVTFNGFGIHVKLPGTVHPDPKTGQVVTEFKELPQFPFEDFDLHFFGSERGILATPTQCGEYPVSTVFEPWDGGLPNQTSTQYFKLESGPGGSACPNGPRPFSPGFEAASTTTTPGSHTTFTVELTRRDGEQNLSSLTTTTPPGFSATLKGIPYCPEAAIAAAAAPGYSGLAEQANPSCPAASQVGEAIAGAGAGTHPYYAPGKVYLAGPYKGAPLSLVVITPAVSGPYDLGDAVVRVALQINSATAQVAAVSDPLPQILEGIPLRLRSILINLNRPNFSLNPTNCQALATTARVLGSEGATASLSSPFQVANCALLPFGPQLALSLSGVTNHTGNPALHAVLTTKPGEANIASSAVTLPHTEFLDNAHIQDPCTRVQFAANQCPAGSLLGFAKAETPLLEKPLEGPIYLRANGGERKLPDLVAALRGQFEIDLVGRIDSINGRLRTTFETVPDAPVSRFTLTLDGGKRGLLQNSINLCSATERANVRLDGQNAKTTDQNPVLKTPCTRLSKRKRATLSRARRADRGERR